MTFWSSTTRQSKARNRRVSWTEFRPHGGRYRESKKRTPLVWGSVSNTSSPSIMVLRRGILGSSWWGKNRPTTSRYVLCLSSYSILQRDDEVNTQARRANRNTNQENCLSICTQICVDKQKNTQSVRFLADPEAWRRSGPVLCRIMSVLFSL